MSIKKAETEAEQIEGIKKKVDKMYENYGVDPKGMDDGDLSRVYRHYFDNRKELDSDYQESERYTGRFDEDDMI